MRATFARLGPVLIAYVIIGILGILAVNSYRLVWVAGGSMENALLPGDVVLASRNAPVRRGDIALLKPGVELVLHRVIRVDRSGGVWTAGDANPVPDLNPTPRHLVVGRVVRVVPFGALLRRWRGADGYDTLAAQSDSSRR